MISVFVLPVAILTISVSCAFLYHRWEWKFLLAVVPLFILQFFLSGQAAELVYLVIPVIIGSIGGYTFKRGKSFEFFILIASCSVAVMFISMFYYSTMVENVDVAGLFEKYYSNFLSKSGAPAELKQEMLADFDKFKTWFLSAMPSVYFIFSVLLSGLSYSIIKKVFSLSRPVDDTRGLEYFQLNEYFIFAFIAGWGVFLLVDRSEFLVINTIALNAGLTASFLYIIQALGIMKFGLLKKGMPPFILPVAVSIIIMTGFLALFFFVIMIGFGTLDMWADFRKLKIEEDKSDISK